MQWCLLVLQLLKEPDQIQSLHLHYFIMMNRNQLKPNEGIIINAEIGAVNADV